MEPPLLAAEGRRAEAVRVLEKIVRDAQGMHAERPADFTPVFFVSQAYRAMASLTAGQESRSALLQSAANWKSWPATSFTAARRKRTSPRRIRSGPW